MKNNAALGNKICWKESGLQVFLTCLLFVDLFNGNILRVYSVHFCPLVIKVFAFYILIKVQVEMTK